MLSPRISHKSDIGGVRPNLTGPGEVRRAYREIMERARALGQAARVTVQEMGPASVEVIVGLVNKTGTDSAATSRGFSEVDRTRRDVCRCPATRVSRQKL